MMKRHLFMLVVCVVQILTMSTIVDARATHQFIYTVQPHDTLSEIVYDHTGSRNFKRAAKINKIRNPDLIFPAMRIKLKIPKWALKEEQVFRDYTVRVYRYGEGFYQILKRGIQVYADSGGVYHIGSYYEDETESKLLRIGTNVTGDGQPNLLILDWSGGAHCCFSFHLFQIGDKTFQHIQTFDTGHTDYADFVNLDTDPALELRLVDWAFAYWRTSFANSPAPEVILKYNGHKYKLDYDLMRKPSLSEKEFDYISSEIMSLPEWEKNHPPVKLWKEMLMLIYSGNMPQAWKLVETSWPNGIEGKNKFIFSFKNQLQKSFYWKDIQILNQKTPIDNQ